MPPFPYPHFKYFYLRPLTAVLVAAFWLGLGGFRLHGESPHEALLTAVQANDFEATKLALSNGANPNYRLYLPDRTQTPLGEAFKLADLNIVDTLLQKGADPWLTVANLEDTPGCLAAGNAHPRTMQLLGRLGTGRSIELLQVVAQCLAETGNVEAVKGMTANGLTPEHVSDKGGCAFFWALIGGQPQAAEEILHWAGSRLDKRFDKNLDAHALVQGISDHPWHEEEAAKLVDEMYLYGVQFFVPDAQGDVSPGALANKRRLPLLAKHLGWTGESTPPLTLEDHAVVGVRHAKPELLQSLYQAAKKNGAKPDLEGRMLANYLAKPGKFDPTEAKKWLKLGADLNAVVDIPTIGKTTASAMLLTADIVESERAARLQWITEQGAKPYDNLRLSNETSLAALKSLYVWAKPPSPEQSEQLLATLILWHAEDRHWQANLRGILAFFCEQKTSLGKSEASKDALAVLARRPEPRLLSRLDTKRIHADIIQKYKAASSSKFPGKYTATISNKSAWVKLQADGTAEFSLGDNVIYATWVQDENNAPTATLTTPIRSYFLRNGLEGTLEIRHVRYKHIPDYVFEPLKSAVETPQQLADAKPTETQGLVSHKDLHLTTLPDKPADWEGAKSVNVSQNRLTTLPDSLLSSTSLVNLDASENWLTTLPIIRPMISLRSLNVAGNGFGEDMPWLRYCHRLRELNLANNRLRRPPAEVASLKSLEVLDLSGNQLASVPALAWQMPGLQQISLARNEIKSLPPELLVAGHIKVLDLSQNQIAYDSFRGSIQVKKIILTGNGYNQNETTSLERRYPHVIWGKAEVEDKFTTMATR